MELRPWQQFLAIIAGLGIFLLLGLAIISGNSDDRKTFGSAEAAPGAPKAPAKPTAPKRPAGGFSGDSLQPFSVQLSEYTGDELGMEDENIDAFINMPLADASILGRMGRMYGLLEYQLDQKEDAGEAVPNSVWTLQEKMGTAWGGGDYLEVTDHLHAALRQVTNDQQAPDPQFDALWADDSIAEFLDKYVADQRDPLKARVEQAQEILKEKYGEELEGLGAENPLALDLSTEAKASFDAEDYATAYHQTRELFTTLTGDPAGWEQAELDWAKQGKLRMDVLGRGDLFLGGIERLRVLAEARSVATPEFSNALNEAANAWQDSRFADAYALLDRALTLTPEALADDADGVREMLFETSLGEIVSAMRGIEGVVKKITEYATEVGMTPAVEKSLTDLKATFVLLQAGHIDETVERLEALEAELDRTV